MRFADERCEVRPGTIERPDLTVRMSALLFLALHRGEASAAWALVSGRIRLRGRRRLFLLFPRLFPNEAGSTWLHRWAFRVRGVRRKRESWRGSSTAGVAGTDARRRSGRSGQVRW